MNSPKTHQKALGWLLTDQYRVYTPSYKTEILESFKALGWIPPSEARKPIIGVKSWEK